MSRRFYVIPAVLALAAAPLAHASDQTATRVSVRESIVRFAPRVELTELFARIAQGGTAVESENGVSAPMVTSEVLVARLSSDGKPIVICVDNEESARRFLDSSLSDAQRGRKQEQ
jgi:hypothetical protein